MDTHFPSSVSSSLFPPLPRFLLCARSSFTFSRTSNQLSLLWPSLYSFLTGPSPSSRLPIIYTQISCSLSSSLLYLPLLCRSSCLLKTKVTPSVSSSSLQAHLLHWNLAASTHSAKTVLSKVFSGHIIKSKGHFRAAFPTAPDTSACIRCKPPCCSLCYP